MYLTSTLRKGATRLSVGGVTACAFGDGTGAAEGPPNFVQDGEAGFVVSHFQYALSKDANETGACPNGMTTDLRGVFQRALEGKRRDGESDQDYTRRISMGARKLAVGPNGENACMSPEAFPPDQNFRTVEMPNIPAYGIDIDGKDSHADDAAAPGMCAHNDFIGFNGEHGIDNQVFRVVGCSNSFQSTGQSKTNTISMLAGEGGILFRLRGVDDVRNDPDAEVGIYANADPIELSPNREPPEFATYAITQDPRFRAETHGQIKDGVPEGYVAGYTPVEELYDFQYGYRNGKTATGELSDLRLRSVSSNGSAAVNNHTRSGAYDAMYAAADAHPDENGRCTWISTQYMMTAIPAFLADVASESANKELDAAGYKLKVSSQNAGNKQK